MMRRLAGFLVALALVALVGASCMPEGYEYTPPPQPEARNPCEAAFRAAVLEYDRTESVGQPMDDALFLQCNVSEFVEANARFLIPAGHGTSYAVPYWNLTTARPDNRFYRQKCEDKPLVTSTFCTSLAQELGL